ANVPQVFAAENGNERLLLYNLFVLDNFEKSGRRDWRIAVVIAHQIGHHANRHSLELERHMRLEIELEADRFAGYLLFQLGATLEDIKIASTAFASTQANTNYPDRTARVAAITEGWHDARVEAGGSAF